VTPCRRAATSSKSAATGGHLHDHLVLGLTCTRIGAGQTPVLPMTAHLGRVSQIGAAADTQTGLTLRRRMEERKARVIYGRPVACRR
jgi:hypothetical protein